MYLGDIRDNSLTFVLANLNRSFGCGKQVCIWLCSISLFAFREAAGAALTCDKGESSKIVSLKSVDCASGGFFGCARPMGGIAASKADIRM
jgi:hypothetical protein